MQEVLSAARPKPGLRLTVTIPQSARPLADALDNIFQEHGIHAILTHRKKNLMIVYHINGHAAKMFLSATPSDFRAVKNVCGELRRKIRETENKR